jgi:hypothetical protein
MTSKTTRQRANDVQTRPTQHADDPRNSVRKQRERRANQHVTTSGTAHVTGDKIK